MTIITQKQVQLTSQLAENDVTIQPTATVLTLKVREPLLITITHYKTNTVASHGLLYLRCDGLIDWVDTDGSELIPSLFPRLKQIIKSSFNVYLAYPTPLPEWLLWSLDPIDYLPDSVIITVEACSFSLGGGR